MLTTTLLLATLATLMSPCWMILWPWTWTLGTGALGASKSGGGPEPPCCCWRRLAICWGVIVICWWQRTHAEAAITEARSDKLELGQFSTSSPQTWVKVMVNSTTAHTNLSSSDQGWHDDLRVVFGLDVLPSPHQGGRDHCAWASTRHLWTQFKNQVNERGKQHGLFTNKCSLSFRLQEEELYWPGGILCVMWCFPGREEEG